MFSDIPRMYSLKPINEGVQIPVQLVVPELSICLSILSKMASVCQLAENSAGRWFHSSLNVLDLRETAAADEWEFPDPKMEVWYIMVHYGTI